MVYKHRITFVSMSKSMGYPYSSIIPHENIFKAIYIIWNKIKTISSVVDQ
jgi:hypothetical protein